MRGDTFLKTALPVTVFRPCLCLSIDPPQSKPAHPTPVVIASVSPEVSDTYQQALPVKLLDDTSDVTDEHSNWKGRFSDNRFVSITAFPGHNRNRRRLGPHRHAHHHRRRRRLHHLFHNANTSAGF